MKFRITNHTSWNVLLTALLLLAGYYFFREIIGFLVAKWNAPWLWLVVGSGGFGGVVGGLIRHDNELKLCSLNSGSLKAGVIGDVIVGVGGAGAVSFLFAGTLQFNPADEKSVLLLISVSLVAGAFGRSVVETAGEYMLQQARKVAKAEAKSAVDVAGAKTLTLYANIWTNEGRFDMALETADQAIAADPNFPPAYVARGRALKRLGKLEDALATVRKAIDVAPNYATAWFNSSCYKCLLERPLEEVLNDLRKAIELDPVNAEDAKTDEDFERIRGESQFKDLVGAGQGGA